MKHYDDLQRFRDKTGNPHHNFRDLSAQHPVADQGRWAIINQLVPNSEASVLAMGGTVSSPVPQPVDAALFTSAEPVPAPPAPTPPAPHVARPAVAPVSYAQLFAPKAPAAKPRTRKDQPLQSLLERIASCR